MLWPISTGLAIFVNNVNVSDWFDAAKVADVAQHIGVTLKKANVTKIEITFKCGE